MNYLNKHEEITIENIERIGFREHHLSMGDTFIYQEELGQYFEIRIKFHTKEIKSNDKHQITGEHKVELLSGGDFEEYHKLRLNINTISELKSFILALSFA